ncbi:MAG: hypothetical protein OXP09_04385 [Gammaproteobacteria bacterium]|nr:hypothetical protein [Gammaproteobacteria bacterium]
MKRARISEGKVLGIDVGWSEERKSSAVCRLSWNRESIAWKVRRFRANDDDRSEAIREVAGTSELLAVAVDGPLSSGFDTIGRYRSAERILSRGELAKRIGKPGQANSGNGRKLNKQANLAAKTVKRLCRIRQASHDERIDKRAVVEAFPTSFLGVMVRCPAGLSGGARSDHYFSHLVGHETPDRTLAEFVGCLLGSKDWEEPVHSLTNHDDRAAFVCALTALCIACAEYTAVGDCEDGWIVLPPRWAFEEWAWKAVEANESLEKGESRPRASVQQTPAGRPQRGATAQARLSESTMPGG